MTLHGKFIDKDPLLNNEIAELRKKLAESEEIKELFINASYDGYWDWHIQDDYEYMSPRFWEIFGYDPKTKKHHPSEWQDLINEEDCKVAMENFEKHIKSRGAHPYSQEVRYKHKDGSTVTVYCRGQVIEWDKEGKPLRMIGTHTDITPLKKKEEEILKQKKELEKKNHELKDFIYFVQHDMKAPVRHISAHLSILEETLKQELNESAKKSIKFIQEAALKIHDMINDLHKLSILTPKEIQKSPENMTEIMTELKEELLNEKKCEIRDICILDLPTLPVDKGMITHLLANLLENSVKYRRCDLPVTIKIHAKEKSDHWIFSFSDNGVGFEEKDSKQIFNLFQRLKTTKQTEGTGVGLAICKTIIEKHGGEVWATGRPKKGATIFFTLPKN